MNKISKIYTIITILAGVISISAIIGRVVYIQYVEGDKWLALAEKIEKRKYKVEAPRGNIYSHDGHLLVTTTPQYYMRFYLRSEYITQNNGAVFYKYLDSLAIELNKQFPETSADAFKGRLTEAFQKLRKGGSSTIRLYSKPVSHSQRLRIEQVKMFGDRNYFKSAITWDTLWVRKRPYGNLGQRLLGNTYPINQYNKDSSEVHYRGTGMNGLENFFDEYLRGEDGVRQVIHAYGSDVALNVVDPIAGHDIITTLDIDIQDIVESELESKLRQLKGEWGTAIMMDVKTGGILACANLGRTQNGYDEINNYATWRVEPGSTMKTMSVMAALESGRLKMTDTIDVGDTGIYLLDCATCSDRERKIIDWTNVHKGSGLGKITLMEALYSSSNIGIAKAIMQAYGKDYDKYLKDLHKLGIDDPRSIELNNLQTPRLDNPENNVTFARMSYGYFAELPPLYTLRFYNAIANNGTMMKPYVCKAIVKDDEVIKEFEPEVIRNKMCSDHVLRDIRTALENVVWSDKEVWFKGLQANHRIATGTAAQSKLVKIAGKTGTAQIVVGGKYGQQHHRISFCGYFPADNPQYSCIVVIHDPESSGAGGSDCARVLKNIAERTISLKSRQRIDVTADGHTAPLPSIKTGYENTTSKLEKKLRLRDHGVRLDKKSHNVLSFTANEQHIETGRRTMSDNGNEVPNVVGMGARDAVFLLEKAGMNVKMHGKGKVISQSLQPGQRVAAGTNVTITLR